MNITVKVNLKQTVGELLKLSKPGNQCEAAKNDSSLLSCFKNFASMCSEKKEHNNIYMTACAALLAEMQIQNNVPDEYITLSKQFEDLVKLNRKLDVSESRDYVFFAYEIMRELEKLDNSVSCEISGESNGIFALASSEDDISAIAVINNSNSEPLLELEISGLPGRTASIDYYNADEFNQLSVVCNTSTKMESTKVVIPMSQYSVHLFKIR